MVPMMQLSHSVLRNRISSWSIQRVEATLWGKQTTTSVARQHCGQLCSPQRPEQGQSPLQQRYL